MTPRTKDRLTSSIILGTFLTLILALGLVTGSAHAASMLSADSAEIKSDIKLAALAPETTEAVKARLDEMVPASLQRHFDLYLFVSKAARGSAAQHMYIFARDESGAITLSNVWAVSTGRERVEQYFTTTPEGIFALDPGRFFTLARSQKWNNAAMPHAMFFDYRYRTRASGLAIHAAARSAVSQLGQRASGGCIRLKPENARVLFQTIKSEYAGDVPVFAFDKTAGTTNRKGFVERDEKGRMKFKPGYRVLVIVDGFAGQKITASTH